MKIGLKLINTIVLMLLPFAVRAGDEDRTFRAMNASNGLADNSAQTIVCTKTGRMIIITLGNVNFYDGAAFSHVNTDQKYQYPLPNYNGYCHLYFDRRHHIWLKNYNNTTCLNLLTERFIDDPDAELKKMGIKRKVEDLFVDTGGFIWYLSADSLTSLESGRSYLVRKDKNLQDVDVADDKLYLFYEDGVLDVYDVKAGKRQFTSRAYGDEQAAKYTSSSVLMPYEGGFFQIRNGAKESVLLYFNATNRSWNTIMEMPYHLNNLVLQNDCLYLPSEYGYWIYDIRTEEKKHVEELIMNDGRLLTTDINALAFDRQGGMWIGTEKRGLLYSRPVEPPFKVLTWDNPLALQYGSMMDGVDNTISEFNGRDAKCMLIDSRRWTWFGTTTGLYLYKSPQSEPIVLTTRQGLLNNVIHSIIEDNDHNMWVSTSYGVSVIKIRDEEVAFVNSFNDYDGVPNESFTDGKVMKLGDGTIVMQALDHVLTFQPRDFEDLNTPHHTELYPKLVRLLVNGTFVQAGDEVGGNVVTDRAVTRTKIINLDYDQNSLSLTFSGLNYFRPIQTYYRVRTKGIDDHWRVFTYSSSGGLVDVNGLLHYPLNSLKPGSYSVEVQTSMYPDLWDNEPYEWVVVVNQPWWRTTGMFMLLAVVLLSLLALNFYMYNRNTRLRLMRSGEERSLLKRLLAFVEKCDDYSRKKLLPSLEEVADNADAGAHTALPPEFIEAMLVIIPYLHEHKPKELTMNKLCSVTGMEIEKFYEMISANLYKSPYVLDRILRMRKAAELLKNSNDTIENVANKCGYLSPNYFISSFYHIYRMTPSEYRQNGCR